MIDKRERCALALKAFKQHTGMSQRKMAKKFHVGNSTISNIINTRNVVSEKTMEMITTQCEHERYINIDNARERIRNYIDDHAPLPDGSYTVTDFARAIGEPARMIEDFLSDDEKRMYKVPLPALHVSCSLLGINYTKLISPLTAADYAVTV
ncbi:helix-turn-helix domain-containing protein [Lacticaseibacillus baoqingensis]|uniref:Helix-turn-helix domain-containing protein n=1 Tax=Lacticaseibacillus baoqingensis TaxID=2486013 RepID=A0ABW4E6V8_9LACO|nr:helix-turn-helix transcriptional regulator [Lacticaseibacillus baoqingensis]